jgi:hypothetical protein
VPIRRFVGEGLKAGFKSRYVAVGLLDSEGFDGVVRNLGKIGPGAAAQPELSHCALCGLLRPRPGFRRPCDC